MKGSRNAGPLSLRGRRSRLRHLLLPSSAALRGPTPLHLRCGDRRAFSSRTEMVMQEETIPKPRSDGQAAERPTGRCFAKWRGVKIIKVQHAVWMPSKPGPTRTLAEIESHGRMQSRAGAESESAHNGMCENDVKMIRSYCIGRARRYNPRRSA